MYNEYMTWDQYYQLQDQINWYNSYNNWLDQQQSEYIPGKSCTKCYEFKPYNEYYKQKDRGDGYRSQCKVCTNESNNKWNQTQRTEI